MNNDIKECIRAENLSKVGLIDLSNKPNVADLYFCLFGKIPFVDSVTKFVAEYVESATNYLKEIGEFIEGMSDEDKVFLSFASIANDLTGEA